MVFVLKKYLKAVLSLAVIFCGIGFSFTEESAIHAEELDLLNWEDDCYLQVGDSISLKFEERWLNNVPGGTKLEYQIDYSYNNENLTISEDGQLTVSKPGIFDFYYRATLTPESAQLVQEQSDSNPTTLADVWVQKKVYVSDNPYVYRLYNPNTGEHFYTLDKREKVYLKQCGWNDEDYAWLASESNDIPVYRLYIRDSEHIFTTDKNEYDYLGSIGYIQEGIAWYCGNDDSTPVWRQYNINTLNGHHNFTANPVEDNYLRSIGWSGEGIAWYVPEPLHNYVTNDTPVDQN